MATKKPSKKAEADRLQTLAESCASAIRLMAEGQNSVTRIIGKDCQTESDVIFACVRMAEAVKLEDKVHQPKLARDYKNSVTQYITRCRSGDITLPATWFDPARTVSFASELPEFVAYKPRATKGKADKQAEAEAEAKKQAEAVKKQAEALLQDEAVLTKAQETKVKQAQAEAEGRVRKAQDQAKRAISLAQQSESEVTKLRGELSALQSKYNELSDNYGKALRLNDAFKKALQLANVEADAVDALIRHVK